MAAKKKANAGSMAGMCLPNGCSPKWVGWAVLVVGLLFALEDLGVLGLGGLTLWPVVVFLVGLAWLTVKY